MNDMAKVFIGFGGILIVIGFMIYLFGRIPGLGRLPGDIFFRRGNFSFFFPITTSILISIVATIFLSLFSRK